MNGELRHRLHWAFLGLGVLGLIGSAVFSMRNGDWCLACQSLGMIAAWWAFWDRLVSVDCQMGTAIRALKQINGEPTGDDRVPDEDEYYEPIACPPSSESPASGLK